jgi:hypothetical protein
VLGSYYNLSSVPKGFSVPTSAQLEALGGPKQGTYDPYKAGASGFLYQAQTDPNFISSQQFAMLTVASLAIPVVGEELLALKMTSFAGRLAAGMTINAAVGGGSEFIMSGGDVMKSVEWADINALIPLGGGLVSKGLSIARLGITTTEIPLESGNVAKWSGLYAQRGENAIPLIGRYNTITEADTIKPGYLPVSPIETRITLNTMKNLNYPSVTNAEDIRSLMSLTKNTRSKFIEDMLPLETKTLSANGVSVAKSYFLEHPNTIDEVYGSFSAMPQLKYGLRVPGDIDVQLKTDLASAQNFAKGLSTRLLDSAETVRISPESPTLIESLGEDNQWHHAVDIHFKGETPDVLNPATEGGWGFKFHKSPIQIENQAVMPLSEHGLRKGSSIMGFQEGGIMGPAAHRMKDIPDFFAAQKTLLESRFPSVATVQGKQTLSALMGRYGITDKDLEGIEINERTIFRPRPSSSSPSLGLGTTSLDATSITLNSLASDRVYSSMELPSTSMNSMSSMISSGSSSVGSLSLPSNSMGSLGSSFSTDIPSIMSGFSLPMPYSPSSSMPTNYPSSLSSSSIFPTPSPFQTPSPSPFPTPAPSGYTTLYPTPNPFPSPSPSYSYPPRSSPSIPIPDFDFDNPFEHKKRKGKTIFSYSEAKAPFGWGFLFSTKFMDKVVKSLEKV